MYPTSRSSSGRSWRRATFAWPLCLLLLLLLLVSLSVHSFSFVTGGRSSSFHRSQPHGYLSVKQASSSSATVAPTFNFWGQERTLAEIQQHVFQSFEQVGDDTTFQQHNNNNATAVQVEVLSAEPPLVLIHNFLSPNDCQCLLQAAKAQQLARSTMNAAQEESNHRTSSTVWLRDDSNDNLYHDTSTLTPNNNNNNNNNSTRIRRVLRTLAERTARVSQLPPSHQENLQVVRYLPNQEFQLHTDHLDTFNDLPCRGRLATCLVYLQPPEEGGETRFPELAVNVVPTPGAALFFWNTVERPGSEQYEPDMFLRVDHRMRHAGLPVTKGEKWICNRWIHPVDYKAGVQGLS